MGRLVASALFSSKRVREHRRRAQKSLHVTMPHGDAADVRVPDRLWDDAAKGSRKIDPSGEKAFKLAKDSRKRGKQK